MANITFTMVSAIPSNMMPVDTSYYGYPASKRFFGGAIDEDATWFIFQINNPPTTLSAISAFYPHGEGEQGWYEEYPSIGYSGVTSVGWFWSTIAATSTDQWTSSNSSLSSIASQNDQNPVTSTLLNTWNNTYRYLICRVGTSVSSGQVTIVYRDGFVISGTGTIVTPVKPPRIQAGDPISYAQMILLKNYIDDKANILNQGTNITITSPSANNICLDNDWTNYVNKTNTSGMPTNNNFSNPGQYNIISAAYYNKWIDET